MKNYPFDMGTYSWPVSTKSSDAQTWFDRGLNWVFGYNHEEAASCFEQALVCDADFALAYWGKAYCVGPNYNMPWELFDPPSLEQALKNATDSISAAKKRLSGTSPVETALINALEHRHPTTTVPEDLYVWSRDYAEQMKKVRQSFPDNPTVAMLYVESLMNLTPWKMWNPVTGEVGDGAATVEAREILESTMYKMESKGAERHPGLLHLYIHLMEMSPTPEVALHAADELRQLVPDAGHLKHMSTHIDVLCGDYQNVVDGNSLGIEADLKYWRKYGAMNFYSLYRIHNYHFKLYGAMFLGNYAAAMEAVDGITETIPDELLRMESPPMADFIEGYMGMKTHVLVRFGKWNELIADPLPVDAELYCMTAAINCYGKGIAYAATGNHKAATLARVDFEKHAANVPEERYVHVVSCQDILGVAREMLNGEMEYHQGNYESAFKFLRQAVSNEDALPYDEPWGWMMPSRHALGALLLEQGYVEQALESYEADLGLDDSVIRSNQHPDNVWALLGLYECYRRHGRQRDARMIKPRLNFALARSDLKINASCFCALSKNNTSTNKDSSVQSQREIEVTVT